MLRCVMDITARIKYFKEMLTGTIIKNRGKNELQSHVQALQNRNNCYNDANALFNALE